MLTDKTRASFQWFPFNRSYGTSSILSLFKNVTSVIGGKSKLQHSVTMIENSFNVSLRHRSILLFSKVWKGIDLSVDSCYM